MTTFSIHRFTNPDDITESLPATTRVQVQKRIPTRYYVVDVPASMWPSIDDVPDVYKALVNGALIASAEKILDRYVSNANNVHSTIPQTLFSLEAMLASSDSTRMTSKYIMQLWKNSHKYILGIAPKLALLTGSAKLKYMAAMETHEKRLTKLVGAKPETTLSERDLDLLLTTLDPADLETPLGEYIALRTEEIRPLIQAMDNAL